MKGLDSSLTGSELPVSGMETSRGVTWGPWRIHLSPHRSTAWIEGWKVQSQKQTFSLFALEHALLSVRVILELLHTPVIAWVYC